MVTQTKLSVVNRVVDLPLLKSPGAWIPASKHTTNCKALRIYEFLQMQPFFHLGSLTFQVAITKTMMGNEFTAAAEECPS